MADQTAGNVHAEIEYPSIMARANRLEAWRKGNFGFLNRVEDGQLRAIVSRLRYEHEQNELAEEQR